MDELDVCSSAKVSPLARVYLCIARKAIVFPNCHGGGAGCLQFSQGSLTLSLSPVKVIKVFFCFCFFRKEHCFNRVIAFSFRNGGDLPEF